jgi:thermitase
LVISVNPGLTASQVRNILEESVDDLGSAGWDPSYGWGRVNAARAVNTALGTANATEGAPDSTPPTVTITGPTAGATVIRTASVYVTATDNVGVVRVELYLDGQRVAATRATPFTTWWRTHWYVFGAHTLQCKAYDAAGNVGISAPVTVNRLGSQRWSLDSTQYLTEATRTRQSASKTPADCDWKFATDACYLRV